MVAAFLMISPFWGRDSAVKKHFPHGTAEVLSLCDEIALAVLLRRFVARSFMTGAASVQRRGIFSAQANTRLPFRSRISPLPSVDDGMFSGPILSSSTFTWP